MKLYISGPVTGIADQNRSAFRWAKARLEAVGYKAIDPHDVPLLGFTRPEEAVWSDYMKTRLVALLESEIDGIVTLPGAEGSRGSRLECLMARELDITVGPEEFWLTIKKER